MLLSMMRRHAKSWLIKFLIGIIAIVFIFYFGYSFTSKEGVKVAVVNGETISGLDYQKAYRDLLINLQKEYQSVWSDNLIKVFDLKNRALEGLIDEKVLSQEARRIGLDVTEEEIREEIISYPSFQFNGRFDENRYRALLSNNRMKPEDFEKSIARSLLQRKLNQFLLTFLPVSAREVREHYTFSNQQVKVSFVRFAPGDFRESITSDQAGREAYFKEHQEDYRIPEKVTISYITIDPAGFSNQVSVTDQDINNYYEDNSDIFKEQKQVRARHILFPVPADAPVAEEQAVRDRALPVLERALSGEDFSELARQFSEGPTREKGGDLGWFSKGQMVKPFETTVFSMERGQVSDLVRTSFGFHIIKLEDVKEARTKPLTEVRDRISETLISNDCMDLANEKALSLLDQMPYDVDLASYAEEHKVPVAHTGEFSQNEPIPVIGGDQKLMQTIFSLEKGSISDLIEFDDTFYIIQITEKKPSYLPEMEEVQVRLGEDVLDYLAGQEAKSSAEKYLATLHEGKDWDKLAEEQGLETVTTDFFTRQGTIKEIGYSPVLQEMAFSLRSDRIYPDEVFENEKGAFVIRWVETLGIDEEKFEKEKEQYRNSLMMTKHQTVFRDWLENLKAKADIDRTEFERFK